MEIRILGALEVVRDGSVITPGKRKLRSILAQLILAGGRTVSVDRLIDHTWRGVPPPHAAGTLHSYVSNLRRVLEPERRPGEEPRWLVTRPPGYALVLDGVTVDADVFTQGARRTRELLRCGDPAAAYREAEQGLALWRGPVLADLAEEPFVREAAVSLEELRVAVEEDRLEAAVGLGLPSAIGDAEQLAARHPTRERPMLLLLSALYRAGRVAEALDRYEELRRRLAEDLGIDPSAELQELHVAMLRGAGPGSATMLVSRSEPASEPPRAAVEDASDLFGREAEEAIIARFLADVGTGRARWLVWHGEPGIGKTRLVEETARAARARGFAVAWGRCPEDGDAPPQWPIAQVLNALGHRAEVVLADRAGAGMDAATRRFLVSERAATALADVARTVPAVVCIDDVHWADSASLDLLRFCAGQVHDERLGFVLTVRSGVRRQELDQLLTTVSRQPGAVVHDVPALETAHLQALYKQLTGRSLSDRDAARLKARTGGNPFYATELLRLGGVDWRSDTAAALPLTVHHVIDRRLDTLPEDTREVLTVGAVVGLAFDLPVVARAADLTDEQALERLDEALTAGIVLPADRPARCAFAHALIRDTILGDLPLTRRTRLHARIAQALHDVRGPTALVAADRAYHLVAAVPLVDAAVARAAAEDAARAAEDQLAFPEAVGWWETVEQLGPPLSELPRVLTAMARCLLLGGRIQEGRARVVAAVHAARDAGDPVLAAEALTQLRATGGAWPWVRPGEVPTLLLELLAGVLEDLGPQELPLRAATLITYAIGLHYHPDRALMLAVTRKAVAVARRAADDRLLADVLLGACTSVWSVDAVEQLLAMTGELLTLPPAAVAPAVEGAARLVRVNALWTDGALDMADRELARLRQVAEDARSLWLLEQLFCAEIAIDVARGRFASARRRMPEALRIHEMSGLYDYLGIAASEFLIRALDGTLADLDDRYDAGLIGSDGRYETVGLRFLAHGDHLAALAALQRSRANPPYAFNWLATRALQAWLTSELGAAHLPDTQHDEVLEVARWLIEELMPHVGRVAALGTYLIIGPVSLWLGRLHDLVNGPGAGSGHLAAALHQAEMTGMAPFAALARRAHQASPPARTPQR